MSTTSPTRRRAFAVLAGAAVAAPAVAVAAIDPDADIHALSAECARLWDAYGAALAVDDDEGDDAGDRYQAAFARLMDMPARTPRGALAKLLEVERSEPFAHRPGCDMDMVAAAIRDLAAIAGVRLPAYPDKLESTPAPDEEPHKQVTMLVGDDLMAPRFVRGYKVYADGADAPEPGDDCLFAKPAYERADGAAYAIVRTLVEVTETHWRVSQLNPPREELLDRAEYPSVYRVGAIDLYPAGFADEIIPCRWRRLT